MTLFLPKVTILLQDQDLNEALWNECARLLEIKKENIASLRIIKKSMDARKKPRIYYHFQVDLELTGVNEEQLLKQVAPTITQAPKRQIPHPLDGIARSSAKPRHRPIVIGSGPAGTFAAMILTEAGLPPLIIERGEPVERRFRTVNRLRAHAEFSSESNYCYGEGGAGTFSDGKLTCGRNHPLVKWLFQTWVRFGAPEDIMYEAHPHIGTDNLVRICKNMRQYLEENGAEFQFDRRLIDLEKHTGTKRVTITLDNGQKLDTDHLILAIGHSARETYEMLLERGVQIEPKPFAMGARIEHPQDVINEIQYGSCKIPSAAEYKLAAQTGDRGIWTFCMCPGGHLLPTGAQPEHLAINGMSYHARNSGFANAAVVVNVRREDFFRGHPLDGMRLQQRIEREAFAAGGGNYNAPAQRLTDFLEGRDSKGELRSTYKPGIQNARMDKILPSFIVDSLRKAMFDYNKKMRGYITDHSIVAGAETKTSSPIIMVRDRGLQSVSHPGLFPCGEGAGFAGGIVSAALDGVRVARAAVEEYSETSTLHL